MKPNRPGEANGHREGVARLWPVTWNYPLLLKRLPMGFVLVVGGMKKTARRFATCVPGDVVSARDNGDSVLFGRIETVKSF